jgi:hypothetical protein
MEPGNRMNTKMNISNSILPVRSGSLMNNILRLPGFIKGQLLVKFAPSLTILFYVLASALGLDELFFKFVQLRDAAIEGERK